MANSSVFNLTEKTTPVDGDDFLLEDNVAGVTKKIGYDNLKTALENDLAFDADDIDDSATTNKFTTASDISKLAAIEASADVTDESNVVSSLNGATLTSVTVAGTDKVIVQDASDSDNIKTVTAQSIADLSAGTTDHTALSNIGTNTHAQIDTHIADSTIHFTESSIDLSNCDNSTSDFVANNDAPTFDSSGSGDTLTVNKSGSGDALVIANSGSGDALVVNTDELLVDSSGNVSSSGTMTASNLSGTNTGDQTSVSGTSGNTNALNSATTTINVSSATAPTAGQVLTATSGTAATWQAAAGGGITVGSTTITSGTDTKVLFNNSGVVGEYTVSGSGDVALTTSPTFVTPILGTPTTGTLTNCSGYKLSSLVAATASNSIDNLNFAQTWSWSTATTETGLSLDLAAVTTGTCLYVNAASTITTSGKVASFAVNATEVVGVYSNGLALTSGKIFYYGGANSNYNIQRNGTQLRFAVGGGFDWYMTASIFGSVVGFGGTIAATSSAAAPALTFQADTDTGFYRVGADNIGVTCGGTLRADFSATAATFAITVVTQASTTSRASLNIPSGTAPTSPVDGDIWSDGSDILVRLGGTTYTLDKT